jgi:GT2 family glycosyltransferase
LKHHPTAPEILIIDDGSPRDQRRQLQRRFGSNVVIVPVARRRGVTAAWNLGARIATGTSLIFLNNDTRTEARWLEQIIAPLQANRARVTSPQSRPAPEASSLLPARYEGRLLQGWCLAMSRQTWTALGGFDERFAMYFSDTDLQLRILERWPDGLATMPVALAHLSHQTTRNWPGKTAAWRRDQKLFLARWQLSREE